MATSSKNVFKILTADAWNAWQKSDTFAGAGIDLDDGYIHLSTAEQAGETYSRFFVGQQNLVVAEVDLEQVAGDVKWEPTRGGELFPHVYGTIPLKAAVRSWDSVDAQLFEKLREGA